MNTIISITFLVVGFVLGRVWSVLEDRLFPEDTE